MFVGKGKGENKILKEFVWTIIFKIFSPKFLVVRGTTRSQFLVVLTLFLVVEDETRFCRREGGVAWTASPRLPIEVVSGAWRLIL